jgi:hypothetical protein
VIGRLIERITTSLAARRERRSEAAIEKVLASGGCDFEVYTVELQVGKKKKKREEKGA